MGHPDHKQGNDGHPHLPEQQGTTRRGFLVDLGKLAAGFGIAGILGNTSANAQTTNIDDVGSDESKKTVADENALKKELEKQKKEREGKEAKEISAIHKRREEHHEAKKNENEGALWNATYGVLTGGGYPAIAAKTLKAATLAGNFYLQNRHARHEIQDVELDPHATPQDVDHAVVECMKHMHHVQDSIARKEFSANTAITALSLAYQLYCIIGGNGTTRNKWLSSIGEVVGHGAYMGYAWHDGTGTGGRATTGNREKHMYGQTMRQRSSNATVNLQRNGRHHTGRSSVRQYAFFMNRLENELIGLSRQAKRSINSTNTNQNPNTNP